MWGVVSRSIDDLSFDLIDEGPFDIWLADLVCIFWHHGSWIDGALYTGWVNERRRLCFARAFEMLLTLLSAPDEQRLPDGREACIRPPKTNCLLYDSLRGLR